VVVAVHGLTTPMAAFDTIAQGLGAMGYRVLTYDLYGRGLSDAPKGRQDAAFFVQQLQDLLEDQAVDGDVTLMGYSMGGSIVTAAAAAHPHRVARLILLAPAGIEMREDRFDALCRKLPGVGDWLFLTASGWRMRRELLRGARRGDPEHVIAQQAAQLSRKGYRAAVLASRRGLLAQRQEQEHRLMGCLDIPVIVIWGGQDRIIPLSALGRLAQWNRSAKHEVLEAADHALPYRNGVDVVECLRSVLRERH